jgi:hypothetical protein
VHIGSFIASLEADGETDLNPLTSPTLPTCATFPFSLWLVDHFESDRLDIGASWQKMVQNLFCGRVMSLTFWTDLLPASFVPEPFPRSTMFGRDVNDIICVLHRHPS